MLSSTPSVIWGQSRKPIRFCSNDVKQTNTIRKVENSKFKSQQAYVIFGYITQIKRVVEQSHRGRHEKRVGLVLISV